MRNVLKIFFATDLKTSVVVVLCLFAASLFEGLSLAAMLPLLTIATGTGGSTSPVNRVAHELLGGLSPAAVVGVLMLAFIGAIVLKALLMLLGMRYVGYAVAEVSTRFRARLVRQILTVRWSYLLANPLGRFINAVSSQAGQSGEAYRLAAAFMALVLETVVLVGVTFIVSWRLAIGAVVLGVVVAVGANSLVRRTRASARRTNQQNRELVSFLADAMANIKALKAMARQGAFENLLDRKIVQLHKAARKQVITRELLRNVQDVVVAVCLGGAGFLAIAVWQVPVAELVVVGILLSRTVTSLSKLQSQYQAAVVYESPYNDLVALIEEAETQVEGRGGPVVPRLEQGVRLSRVTFGYAEVAVLRDADIEIPARQLTVLTGASGQGKTTIADLVIGLYQPQAGTVLIDGTPMGEVDIKRWRRQIGYVPQEVVLFHDTLFANLTLGDPDLGEAEAREALDLAGAVGFVDAMPLGMHTVVGERGGKLSGGQRQRIGLARALVARPRLLILDEVTSALDPETEHAICARVRALTDETTIFAITHRPAFVDWADRVYRLDAGSLRQEPSRRLATA